MFFSSVINDKLISDHLATKSFPDPELLIRTSGETRISNFLLKEGRHIDKFYGAQITGCAGMNGSPVKHTSITY